MSYTGYPYSPSQDALIRSKSLPDGLLAQEVGVTRNAIYRRRRSLRGRSIEPQDIERVTDEERAAVAREEIEALQARIVDTEALLEELRRMLDRAKVRLVRLS